MINTCSYLYVQNDVIAVLKKTKMPVDVAIFSNTLQLKFTCYELAQSGYIDERQV